MPPFKGQGEHQNPLAFRLAASSAGSQPTFPRAKRSQAPKPKLATSSGGPWRAERSALVQ